MTTKKRRRGHGEGSIYQRSDGRWCATVNLGWRGGRRERKTIYGRTRKEVAGKLSTALAEQKKNQLVVVDGRTTLRAFLLQWLEHTRRTVRPTTHDNYRVLVHKHVIDEIGDEKLAKLTAAHVQALLDRKSSETDEQGRPRLSPRSVQKIRDVLRIAFNWGVKTEVLHRNVIDAVEPPKVEKTERPALSPEQVNRVLEHIPDTAAGALLVVAAATGARRGELRAVQWEQVDLDGSSLRVSGSLQRVRGAGRQRLNPKTKPSRRVIKLPAIAVDALRRQRVRQLEARLVAGVGWIGSEPRSPECYVFTTRHGTPLAESSLYETFRRTLKDAGIERPRGMGLHAFRHAWASIQGTNGTPIRVAMDQGGWSNVATFLETYGHVFDQDRQRAADVIDRILSADHE